MESSKYFSEGAWLAAFIEHRIWRDYLAMAWTDVDSQRYMLFEFTDGTGKGHASLTLVNLGRGDCAIRLAANHFSCKPEKFAFELARANHVGAITELLRLMREIKERVYLVRERAQNCVDAKRVEETRKFERAYFAFLNNEIKRLGEICSERFIHYRRMTAK